MSTREQLQAIASGQIDCGFLNIATPPDGLQTLSIGEEPFVCCLPATHALAQQPAIDLRELARDTFVMFAREVAPANYDNVIACLQQAGIHPPTPATPRASGSPSWPWSRQNRVWPWCQAACSTWA